MGVHVGEEPEEEGDVATIGVGRSAGATGGGVKSSSETELWRDDEDNLGETKERGRRLSSWEASRDHGGKLRRMKYIARIRILLVVCSAARAPYSRGTPGGGGLGADGVPEASLERSEAELSERLSLVFLVVKLKG